MSHRFHPVLAVLCLSACSAPVTQTPRALPTVFVQRTDLSAATRADGSLGYAGSFTVLGPGSGRITWLPAPGDVIGRGRAVFGVDGRAVPLLFGGTPFFRTLGSGVSRGSDVKILEQNLKTMGYGPDLTVDTRFTSATRAAIRRWQHDLGVTVTGTVSPKHVVVMPGPIRITSVDAVPSGPAAGRVLTASGTGRQVTVPLPVASQQLAKPGAPVGIELPGGTSTTGRVTEVGTVATAETTNARSQTGLSTESATITVRIGLDRPSDAGRLDGAPVTVAFTSEEHRDVLAVPVNALLAAADRGYTVEVVADDGTVTAVPVTLGIFDGDLVEVAGALTEGTKVQVPAS
ncbi:peptidoglycan-binding protein [Actinoplanes sp. NPDC026670]|uniref:peptidoglycan-binding protein n=1 Tax=Actinoplanes sp. NPDC026670 TaxID=3154700 RepID=UPI0033C1937D